MTAEIKHFESKGPSGDVDIILKAQLISAHSRHFCLFCHHAIEKGVVCWRLEQRNFDLLKQLTEGHCHQGELQSYWHWLEMMRDYRAEEKKK